MDNFKKKYEIVNDQHTWSIAGPEGGVHIWAIQSIAEGFLREKFIGGIECHWSQPKYSGYHKLDKPNHDNCWLLGGPCWHDGSSLYFSEILEPILSRSASPFSEAIHKHMFYECICWYRNKIL